MTEPQEIEDEEHEQVLQRVAAVDVAKDSGKVCVRVPHESKPGRRVSRVWDVDATTRAVIELGDHLVCQGIEKVTVESTTVIRGADMKKLDIAQVVPSRTRPRGKDKSGNDER